ncbi:MAG: SCO family protein, partial [Solirubrobacterales bacterium]|nr:SCO family protein [Solirubrobacterales bacterium]
MRRNLPAALALVASLALAGPGASEARNSRWGETYIPNLPVTTQGGETLRFYDDLIRDKVVVISFIFTSCPDLCPLTTARLAEVRDMLGDAVGRDIFFISLTVDPEHDTPERMKAFADAFHAEGPGWRFVTGRPEDINLINRRFGDRSAERGLSDHRNEIVIGNGATGDWTRNSALGDLEEVVRDIRSMDPKRRDETRPAGQAGGIDQVHTLSQRPGEVLFRKLCSSCHTIGVGDRAGPDLRGVTGRRDAGWLTRFITNPPKARASGDPGLAAVAAGFPGVRMPRLGLTEDDAADLVA